MLVVFRNVHVYLQLSLTPLCCPECLVGKLQCLDLRFISYWFPSFVRCLETIACFALLEPHIRNYQSWEGVIWKCHLLFKGHILRIWKQGQQMKSGDNINSDDIAGCIWWVWFGLWRKHVYRFTVIHGLNICRLVASHWWATHLLWG